MSKPPLKVIYVTGWCRSGSTIIGNALNEIDGVTHVGELHFLWKNAAGSGANDLCGCGSRLKDCRIWSQVLSVTKPGWERGAEAVVRRQQRTVRTRRTWTNLRRGVAGRDARDHARLMARVYRDVASLTGASTIVDSSKMPAEGALLPHLEGVEPYFLHLTRDPRAVAYSWRNPKSYIHTMSATRSTLYWVGFNLASHAITRRYRGRSLFLRYEDFIAAPRDVLDRILDVCRLDRSLNPIRDRTVYLNGNHTVTGNPDRLILGETVIRATDSNWRASLPLLSRMATSLISTGLRRSYSYD